MTQAELDAALDEARALPLALLETLTKKLAPGSFLPLLSKTDVDKTLARVPELVARFKKERAERASRLILPPGK
jgi:hypothetical protein